MSFSLIRHSLAAIILFLGGVLALSAQNFELLDGQVMTGPPISVTKDGVAFRDAAGNQGPRVGYTNLTQQALRELQKTAKWKKFVEPFLELPIDSTNRNKVSVELKPFERLDRPDPRGGLAKLAGSGLGLLLLFVLFAGNLYSAYEVGVFRNYSPYLVAGIALVLPVVTQVIFLCLPTYIPKSTTEEHTSAADHVPEFAMPGANQSSEAHAAAAAAPAAEAALPHYKRGEFTFNKRFFETKMGGFYGVRAIDAEKGFSFDVKSNRGTLSCARIVRIAQSEICLQVRRGGSMEEVSLPFNEIVEIEIKKGSH